jgi:MSHA biogenesis protein MshQ
VYGCIKKICLFSVLWVLHSNPLFAAVVQLNATGGTSATNALRIYIDDTTQIQVRRLNNTGQLYSPSAVPTNNNLDNGIYLRANGTMYGPDHFAYSAATDYSSRSVSTVLPATPSQGVTQSTTSSFRVSTLGPQVSVVWKYIYPLDYVTAEVTLVVPITYPVSASNPVRYYHAIDTYLGGSDNGCGVRYIDANGKQVVGTYPLSSGNCPSSNSLPANLDVVESFRERNGKFDHYCVGFWNTFWTSTTSNACAIGKSTSLSDTVSTTYQDTGAAIEYDFTAPGTYTFSYDFVVGSTFVPNYDHLEIRHPGTATLCPVDVQVLACTSSVVPCPDDSLVNTGSLTGTMTYSPGTPTMTATPNPFELGSSGPLATVTLQGSGAATYTLGATGLSKAPLNGVKCFNTATNSQSCSFTFTNTPCVDKFECMENAQPYNNLSTNPGARNPLYTKVVGNNIDVDVVAVLTNGEKSTGYNSALGVTVELMVENAAGTCGASTDVVARKILVPFAASDNGRKKVTFTASDFSLLGLVQNAYPKLRCKVTDPTLNKSGCSSDNFALRPQSFTVTSTSSNLTQSSPSPSITSPRKAWTDTFNLKAVTGESNYSGTPKINPSRVLSHTGEITLGKFGYVTAPPPIPVVSTFPAAVSGSSSGDTFVYSEVGFFRFDQYGVYDDTFTAVDSAKGDCNNEDIFTGSTFNPNSFNNNGVKNGCRFGNVNASSYFGRFIPDHFRVEVVSVTKACSNKFTYYGQDVSPTGGVAIPFNVYAENGANETTQNYAGVPGSGIYAKFDPAVWTNYTFTTNPPLGSGNALKSANNPALPTGWTNGKVSVDAKFKIDRPATQTAPQTVTFYTEISDSDGTVTKPTPKVALDNTTSFRYGRLAIPAVHGSELLPLPVKIEAQYWAGGDPNSYRRNIEDNCTTIPVSSVVMKNYKGQLNACETQLSVTSAMSNGALNLRLSAPGVTGTTPNTGSVDLEVNLGAASPGETTCLSATESSATGGAMPWFGAPDPAGRATFGVYKAPIIYMRENFGP